MSISFPYVREKVKDTYVMRPKIPITFTIDEEFCNVSELKTGSMDTRY